MGIKYNRVEESIQILEHVCAHRPRKFYMGTWLSLTREEEVDFNHKSKATKKPAHVAINGCGTQACGLGWIASDARAIRRGLHVEFPLDGGNCEVRYRDREGLEAGAEYFGITEDTADMLFLPSYYKHETGKRAIKAVVTRLRCLMDAPTAQLGEIAVADAALHTGCREYRISDLLCDRWRTDHWRY